MFSQACAIPSVHRGRGDGFAACITGHMTGGSTSGGVCIQGRRGVGQTPPPRFYGILSTSGRYASYWNAFLSCYYRLQTKFAKVMFLHVSVYPQGRYPPLDRYPPPGQVPPPGTVPAGRYGQQAGGTHPTGMHSCVCYVFSSCHSSNKGRIDQLNSVILVLRF